MDRTGFRILPRGYASLELQESIAEILERVGVPSPIPGKREVIVRVEAPVQPGASVREAHANWTAMGMRQTKRCAGLPFLDANARCPEGLILVSVERRENPSGGMGSYYGFKGEFVSLLVSEARRDIHDARWEPAK